MLILSTTTIIALSVGAFLLVILSLVFILMFAQKKLVPSGDIKIIGPRADERPWRIALGSPSPDSARKIIELQTGAVASSGDYERYSWINGQRYSHILNPKTGWPVQYLSAVSVVADFCVIAGSLSTIAMLKESAGPDWLSQTGSSHLWVDCRGHSGGNLSVILE